MSENYYIRRLLGSAAAIVLAVSLSACGKNREESLALARVDQAGGQANAAIIRLRSILATDPEYGEARLLLGQLLLENGDATTAEKELRRAFDAGIDTDIIKPLLARALLERGDYKKVLADFSPQQIRMPEARAEVLVSQAFAQLILGHVEAAKAAVSQAVEASPGHLGAAIATALITGVEGDYGAATVAIDEVLVRQPKSVAALRAKASIAQGKGDQQAAIQALQTLTQLRPTDVAAHYTAVMLLWQAGRMADARKQVENMQAAAAGYPQTEHVLALLAFRDKDLTAARDHIALALKSAPEFGPSLLLSGMINAELGAYELAEHGLSKVLEKDPNNLPAQQALMGIMLRTHRVDSALLLAQDMVSRAGDQPRALMAAAAVYLNAGDTKKARSLFEKANALGAKDARALTSLAVARMASGDAGAIDTLIEASAVGTSSIEADLLLINFYVGRQEFDKALKVLATMANKRPGDVRILTLEGEVLVAAGHRAEARPAFERAYELRPDLVAPLRHLARLDLADGRSERAKKRFKDAIDKRPQDADLLLAYAEWLHDSNSEADAVRAVVVKALEVAPKDVNVRVSLAAFYASRRDYDRAVTVAEEATRAIPGNTRLLTLLAELQIQAGKPELAVNTLAKAIESSSGSPVLLVRLADLQLANGDGDAAITTLREAIRLQPGFRPAGLRLLALQGSAASPAEMIEAARELQRSQPDAPVGYFLEAKAFVQQGNWPEAVRVLKTGIEKSNAPQLVIGLHSALIKSGRTAEAAKAAADWAKLNPKDLIVRSYLADSALAARDYPTAVRIYKEVVADSPNNLRALNNLAWAAGRAGDPMALDYAERASRLAPDDPNTLDTLGWLLVERGDLVRGTEILRRASAAAPNAANLRFNLAKALIKSGDPTGARRELEVLAKLGDSFREHAEVRKLLDAR
ncbi:XrtA/PEP-CTERM system TPR-repeat protein PrsT [Candidatus Accumulibacter sp. ACC003]|uniref:XrtA/PEP-CTERM system TPR-repeat protein PrsT n=1 Tax=Candidatus Accumulibacter sp. ACC003 TaxID=2823334 RepID=UPI0025C09864|nr:XrtA/PEP-CTERM system TPR-repeat protein PrsT [Candidatus Accumulibacter sp. ACC003]